MRTTKADFRAFKESFQRYATLFGLAGYRVEFAHTPLAWNDGGYVDACIHRDEDGKFAEVCYTTDFPDDAVAENNPKAAAKHEAIHLMLSRIVHLAQDRWSRQEEIKKEEEQLVRVLEKVIP